MRGCHYFKTAAPAAAAARTTCSRGSPRLWEGMVVRRPCLNLALAQRRAYSEAAEPAQAASKSLPGLAGGAGAKRPSTAPKPVIDIRHIRENPDLYSQNCMERNYARQSTYPAQITNLFKQWKTLEDSSRPTRTEANAVQRALKHPQGDLEGYASRKEVLSRAKALKDELQAVESAQGGLVDEMHMLAVALPNLTSDDTPRGSEPAVLSYINEAACPDRPARSHVDIGAELGILDFTAAGNASGWGWYYLLNEGAQLEQALVQYALAVATRHGWDQVSPPTMVYSHIADACGFRPRDQNDEQQIYTVAQDPSDVERGKPGRCLAGTSEIALAGMKANAKLDADALPVKRVAASRCFRAEAGARGVDTKGLYRVHEFTKVELFAWTRPDWEETEELFDEILDMQTEILGSLGLRCRVLEMPSADLGASAARKCDMEAFFPSRTRKNDGWGEVTSASICTDYQTRRLGTRVRIPSEDRMGFPWTVNGTALAVPRVLAGILENGWDEGTGTVAIPDVLRFWMDGKERIGPAKRRDN